MKQLVLREYTPLITALLLPILFICGVLLFTLPTRQVETTYSVVFARCPQLNEYWRPCAIGSDATYKLDDLALKKQIIEPRVVTQGEKAFQFVDPELVEYSPRYGIVHLLTNTDMPDLRFVSGATAPDGTRMEYRYARGNDFFFFGGRSNGGWYLVNGKNAQKIDPNLLGVEPYAGADRIEVVGWVEE